MDVLWKDVVYSLRMLLKRPSLTAVAIMAIALAIGANTAIFSVVNSVILQPLPYEEPQQLVNLATEQRDQALDGQGAGPCLRPTRLMSNSRRRHSST